MTTVRGPYKTTHQVVAAAVPLDKIVPILSPPRAMDLRAIMALTPFRLRTKVALAFADMTIEAWSMFAGFKSDAVKAWLRDDRHMPMGAGFRLARVLGVPAEELFEGWS